MKRMDLLEVMGNIDERFLLEAQARAVGEETFTETEQTVTGVHVMEQRSRGRFVGRMAAMAAALVLLVGGAAFYVGRSHFGTGSAVVLTNHMTATERNRITAGEQTLLADETTPHTVELEIWDKKDRLAWLEDQREEFSAEEYAEQYALYTEHTFYEIHGILLDGQPYTGFMPYYGYRGGKLNFAYTTTTMTDGVPEEPETHEVSFDHFEEFCTWYSEDYLVGLAANGEMTRTAAEQAYRDMQIVFEAVMEGTYTVLDRPIEEVAVQSDYRAKWEFDAQGLEEIADAVTEYTFYDEALDAEFVVHVTLPPEYDASQTYPAFVLTDGVWRFGNHPELWDLMAETEDVILVSVGCGYAVDGTDNAVRARYFCEESDLFLDFLTDDLMPYLSECYRIDHSRSVLYGHSLGGVFTHYAAFHSDLYENQPFGTYIIGSPAFWSPYFQPTEQAETYRTEYGYFERNANFTKQLFLCGGEKEDADYADYYGENESTLEGLEGLLTRLEGYGVETVESRIYADANHYDYIPAMLCDVLRTYFGT